MRRTREKYGYNYDDNLIPSKMIKPKRLIPCNGCGQPREPRRLCRE